MADEKQKADVERDESGNVTVRPFGMQANVTAKLRDDGSDEEDNAEQER